MNSTDDEEGLLRSVALQNAQSILLARQRAEEEVVRAKEALELKTRELAHSVAMMRATLESTTDAILVTDGEGNVTDFNEKLVQMWQMPLESMKSGKHSRLLEVGSRFFAVPGEFLRRVEYIYRSSPPESYDLLELVDGRVIERISRTQIVDGKNVGRVWSFRDITAFRVAEDSLRKQSEWLRVTLASVGDAVLTTDIEGRVAFLNSTAQTLTGWTHHEAQGRPLIEVFTIVDEETRQPAENPADRALREGRIVGLANHTILVARNGMETPIDDSAAPIRDDKGEIYGVVLVFRDITQRKKADEALRESERRFRLMAETIPSIVWTAAPDGITTYSNERWFEYSGLRPGEDPRRWPELVFHPDDLARCLEAWNYALKNGTEYEVEARNRRHDGVYRWFVIRAVPLRDDTGSIVQWFGTTTDIDDRKHVEQTSRFLAAASATLAELSDYESTLQRVAGLAVPSFADWCAVDMQDNDGSIHRLAAAHTDGARVALVHDLFRLYPPQPSDTHATMSVLRSGEAAWAPVVPDSLLIGFAQDEEHLRLMRQLGLKSYICVPLRSRTRTLGVLTFAMAESGRVYDATDLAAAEDLAHRAGIAIENANLLSALKEADRRKDEFLAMLAHELRNPLAPIHNAVQIFRSAGPAVPELQWATDVIDRQVHQMTRLVDDLLDVSRITRGKIELRRERVELAAIVNSAVEASRPLIEKLGHELIVTVPSEPIHLDADPTRLSQVLSNLLNNAAKYTDEAGRIWVTAEQAGRQVEIRVRDTGIGIPAEMLPRVFDMFTQADRSLERAEGGLGIGLTLVRRLVEMHGGTVEAHSEGPGKGSEFVVRLPFIEAITDYKPQDMPVGDEAFAEPVSRRILVVDDNWDSAESLVVLLGMLGNEVHMAHDGLEAVAAAAEFRPEVILLDIGLPKLNGYEAARLIREQVGGSQVVLIALTGWGQDEDRRLSKEAGFDHHLTKPVDFETLQELLADRNLLQAKRRPTSP